MKGGGSGENVSNRSTLLATTIELIIDRASIRQIKDDKALAKISQANVGPKRWRVVLIRKDDIILPSR